MAQQAIRQIQQVQSQMGNTSGSFNKASTSAQGFRGTLTNTGTQVARFGSQMQWTGRQVEYNFTLPIVAAGAAALKFALDNEAAMVRVIKVYGDGTQSAQDMRNETDALGRAFEALSNQYGVNRAQVIGIAGDWAAAGASGLALAKVTELTLKTMILGEIQAKEATTALIAIQGQYQLSTKELTSAIEMLNMVENQTGISLAGLVDGFARAAGSARSASVDTRHLAAMLSALVPAAGTAAQAGNALKTIFSRLLAPTKEAKEVLGLMGINTADLAWASASATDRLMIMAKAFEHLGGAQKGQLSAQQAVVSSVVASRWQINKFEVLMQDMVNETGRYQTALKATSDDQKVFDQSVRELNAVLDSSPRKLQQIKTLMENALADAIQPMIPAILSLASSLASALEKFSHLDPGVQKLVFTFLLLLAVAGPVLRYLGATATLVGGLARIFALAVGPIMAVGAAFWSVISIPVLAFLSAVSRAIIFLMWTGQVMSKVFMAVLPLVGLGFKLLGALAWIGISTVMASWRTMGPALMAMTAAMFKSIAAVFMAGFQILRGVTFLGWTYIIRIFAAMGAAVGIIPTIIADLFLVLMSRFWAGFLSLAQITAKGVVFLNGVLYRGMAASQFIIDAAFLAMKRIWAVGWAAMQAATASAMATMRAIVWAGTAAIHAVMTSAAIAMAATWRGFMAGLAFLTFAWIGKIKFFFAGLPAFFRAASTAIQVALTGPWGAALVLLVTLVVVFWDQLKQIWKAVVDGTISAFNALPDGIRNALLAVVRIVRAAAMAVYNLFSWMNPWAHHSPSLVENVTTGVAEIKNQFNSLGDIGSVFLKAGLDLETFGKHVRKIQEVADAKAWAELRKTLLSVAPDAIPSFDALVKVLGPLKDLLEDINVELRAQQAVVDALRPGLDAAKAKYDEQKAILDALEKSASSYKDQLDAAKQKLQDFADAPIQGMKAMSDAIFNNSMEQKKLQLQLMQMEDAVGPLDKLQGKLDAINGQMEMLSGEQTNLRNAGAGSEILDQYDSQISALRDQQDAINEQIKPLQELSDAIDELGRKGEELNLEESLKFDPLKRQIDDVANAMKELPFDEILAGVTAQKTEVDKLAEAYKTAQDAVDAQKSVVDQLEVARDALQLGYDKENAKLDELKNKYQAVEDRIRSIEQAFRDLGQAAQDASSNYMSPGAQNFLDAEGGIFADPGGLGATGREGELADQSKMIDDFTKEIADKTANMFGLFDFLDPIKSAWNKAINWLKENVGPAVAAFVATFTGGISGMKNPFDGMGTWVDFAKGVLDDITGAFSSIWNLIGPDIMKFLDETWAALQDAFKQIQPEIEKFKESVGPAGEALSNIWTVLKVVLGVVGAVLMLLFKLITSVLANAIGPLIKGIADVIAGIIRIFRGLIEFIIGVFTGDWERALNGAKDFFLGIWDVLFGAVKGIFMTIVGIFKGLVEGIVGWIKWLWDILFGHSIIPDIVNAFFDWFNKLYNFVKDIFKVIAEAIVWVWEKTIEPVFNAIAAVFGWVVDKIKEGIDKWKERLEFAKLLFSLMKDRVVEVVNSIKDKFWEIVDKLREIVSSIKGHIDDFVDKILGIKDRIRNAWDNIFDGLKNSFKSVMNWIIGKWNDLSFGIGDIKVGTPNIDFFARGGVTNGVAVIGEGRPQYPEYVIPTDPAYRKRAVQLFADLGKQLGMGKSAQGALLASIVAGQQRGSFGQKVQMMASGGVLGRNFKFRGMGGNAVVIAPQTSYKEIHFHGDLSFPNVRDGNDAKTFIENLEAILDEG